MTGFFAILDDIAALMDDVALMAKFATKKTAGVLGDDLAVGAEKASSFRASRELPVLWAITKGSFLNKLLILPFAFLLSAFAPFLIIPILLIGGLYLSYEGVEKIVHVLFHKKQEQDEKIQFTSEEELLVVEKAKIRSTIITDFILSLEIIMIALGTVTEEPLLEQILVVSIVAIVATIGVYGIVALMVRMDDAGMKLIHSARGKSQFVKSSFVVIGKGLVYSLPKLIKLLAVVGTLAMLLVGGGMFVHNVQEIHDFLHALPIIIAELMMGLIVGFIAFIFVEAFKKIKKILFQVDPG
jgi:predicted DNA repair protein MutK